MLSPSQLILKVINLNRLLSSPKLTSRVRRGDESFMGKLWLSWSTSARLLVMEQPEPPGLSGGFSCSPRAFAGPGLCHGGNRNEECVWGDVSLAFYDD